MYSPGTFGILFLVIAATQKLGGEAGPCVVKDRSHIQKYVFDDIEYRCTVLNIPSCRGGCYATMKYDVHVSDANSALSRCSVDVHQCVASGTTPVPRQTTDCKLASDGSSAPEANGNNVWHSGASGCHCVSYYSSATADECENEFVVD